MAMKSGDLDGQWTAMTNPPIRKPISELYFHFMAKTGRFSITLQVPLQLFFQLHLISGGMQFIVQE
jgi:hypothetical protein